MLFRPPETANDGTGWATEEIALFRDGSWSRLSLVSVGLEEGLWPGGAPMGTGELSPDGRLIAWGTDDGVAVLDLYRGSTRLLHCGQRLSFGACQRLAARRVRRRIFEVLRFGTPIGQR